MSPKEIVVRQPETVRETGVSRNFLQDLALKIIYQLGEPSTFDLSEHIMLNLGVVEEIVRELRSQQLCEVRRTVGPICVIGTTEHGASRAADLMTQCNYTGPAPVSLQDYVARVRAQTVRDVDVHAPEVKKAFAHMVLDDQVLDQIGKAVVSGRSIFLYGPSGTGKTAIAETLPRVYTDSVWIPYAVDVEGHIISVFDSSVHAAVEEPFEEFDRRWIRCRRPRVVVGGELTLEMLDLQATSSSKSFMAPLQLKANNGVLIIDDLGRQTMKPEKLMNRWMLPLDRSVDFLTLPGGRKVEVPFDLFVVFTTNLTPEAVGDPAGLRRIQTKMRLDYAVESQFQEIFRRACSEFSLNCDDALADELVKILGSLKEPLRHCYPRDIVQHILWEARYESRQPEVAGPALEAACRSYLITAAA